jgi:4-aminobutyrate aminotransferase
VAAEDVADDPAISPEVLEAEHVLHEAHEPDVLTYEELAGFTEPRIVAEPPGPAAREVIAADGRVTSPSLPRAYAFAPARGAGSVVEDVDGNVFLDFNAGIAVCSTGHAHPKVVEAIRIQSERLLHYSASDFYLPIGGFHGRSYGSVTLTASNAKYHEGFGPLLPGVLHAPFGADDTDRYIENVIFKRLVKPNEIAAIVVEPIQGEGGYVVPPDGWLQYLKELSDRHGIIFIADEIQSGMGRAGHMWAVEHWGVAPDILLAGKGIASGMPLGAIVAREDLMTWGTGAHGSTYGGNPVSCAAALATIDLIKSGLVENSQAVGGFLREGLTSMQGGHPMIREVRGLGLMIGVEFGDGETADAVEMACFRRGLLTLRAGDSTIRISPPLVLNGEQAATGLRLFEVACAEVGAS